jgi:uncharacterized phage protein (TIGR01671 family)
MATMIKFRAWDKNTERMWDIETWHIVDEYVDLIEPGKSIADINAERFWRKQSEIILMQFTGLKDVNGKDIFTGDILKTKAGRIQVVKKGLLSLGEDDTISGFYADDLEDGKPHTFSYDDEIVGNVHTSPEFLEE